MNIRTVNISILCFLAAFLVGCNEPETKEVIQEKNDYTVNVSQNKEEQPKIKTVLEEVPEYISDRGVILRGKDNGKTHRSDVDPDILAYWYERYTADCNLSVESLTENGEEVEEIPEWLEIEVANEDYTTATALDDDGNEYEYFVNGIDYDLVFTAEALPEGVEYRTAKIVFYQKGAKLTVTVTQGVDPDGIHTVVAKTPIKNSRAFNLAGQPVSNRYKGIVVKDGKKVIVK